MIEIANPTDKQIEKEQIEKPIVTFRMESNLLTQILKFSANINRDIPIRFSKDGIVILQKSVDSVQYAQVDIRADELIGYKLDLEGVEREEKVEGGEEKVEVEGEEKEIYNIIIDANSSIENIVDIYTAVERLNHPSYTVSVSGIYQHIDVKVYADRIMFECPEHIILWAQLMPNKKAVDEQHKSLFRLSETIQKIRSDSAIKTASATISLEEFRKVCDVKGEGDCGGYGKRFFTEISNENGLLFTSKSFDGFYKLELKPKCIDIVCGKDEIYSAYIDKEFITPIALLEGNLPITVEIRTNKTNKPIVLKQQLTSSRGICAMLTVAPRLKEEEYAASLEKEKENENKKEKADWNIPVVGELEGNFEN